jgi:hypothetical protein
VDLRDRRRIDDSVLRRVQEALDAEDLRLDIGLEGHRLAHQPQPDY